MVDHVWTVLCEQVLVNQRNKALSYINSTHDIFLTKEIEEGKITKIPFLDIAMKWFKSPGTEETIDVRVSIKDATSDEDVVLATPEINFDAKTTALAISVGIKALPVKHEGLHFIIVEYKSSKNKKWKHASKSPLNIICRKVKRPEKENG